MDFTVPNILQSLHGKTVRFREVRSGEGRHSIHIQIVGRYHHQPSSAPDGACSVSDGTGMCSVCFSIQDVDAVTFSHDEDSATPTIHLKPIET